MAKKQEEALAKIANKIRQANALVAECEAIADKAKVDFYLEVPAGWGRALSYDGSGKDFGTEDGQPTGWNHSQC